MRLSALQTNRSEPGHRVLSKFVERLGRKKLEKTKPAETIFANRLTRAGVEYIDQHILFRMLGEESREYFNELFFIRLISLHEPVTDKEPVRAFAAVQSDPKAGAIGAGFIQPLPVLEDAGFDFFEVDSLGNGEAGKQQCGC